MRMMTAHKNSFDIDLEIKTVLADIDETIKNRKKKATFRFGDDDWPDKLFDKLIADVKIHVKENKLYEIYDFRINGSCMHCESHIQMFLKGEEKTGWGWAESVWVFE